MTFKEKILFSVATYKGWQRYAATLIFLLVVVSCWWFFSYRTVYTALRQAQQYTVVQQAVEQITAVDKESAILNESLTLYPGVADELSTVSLAQTYENRRDRFFVQKTLNMLQDKVLNSCKNCTIQFSSSRIQRLPERKDWYSYAYVQGLFSCLFSKDDDIKKLIHFFEGFESLDNVHIERCHMKILQNSRVEIECLFGIYLPL